MKILKYLSASAIVLFAVSAQGQDVHFSQFYMSPLTMNPSLAGAQNDLQANLNYKSQWGSVSSSPYSTVGASFDMCVNRNKNTKGILAFGINVFSDRAGDGNLGTTQANLSVAYHARLNKFNLIGGGLQAGYFQRSVNASALKWGNQYDGTMYNSAILTTEPAGAASPVSSPDFSAGIAWTFNNEATAMRVTGDNELKACVGFSVMHAGRPDYSFYTVTADKLFIKYVVHGNAVIGLKNSNVAFVPGFMYAMQGPSQEILAGSLIRFNVGMDSKYTGFRNGSAFSFGGYLRARDAIVAAVQLDYANYSIGFSYDINTSSLTTASGGRGGMELSLRYVAPNPFIGKRQMRSFD